MIRFVLQLAINAFALWAAAEWIDGIDFNGDLLALVVVALIFAVVNFLIKPVIRLLTLPLTVITLGLFALVVNTLMLGLTSWLSPAYSIDGFFPALWGSILISILTTVLNWFVPD
jgi:putative membrane protein